MARSPIVLGIAQGRSRPLNAARLVNLYAEKAPDGSMSPWVLYGTPGQKTWATLAGGSIRAARYALGFLYVLSGTTLYRVDQDGTATACTGDAIPGNGIAMLLDNGIQFGLLVNSVMFYGTGTTITMVTDADYPGASSVDYIDGYGAFSTSASNGQWFLSGLFDFSTYDALDFATAESSPDALLRVLANHKEVWLFGVNTTEVWTDTGASPFPFELIPGSLLDRGIGAPLSAIRMDNAPFWLGDDRIVYRANGYTPARVSTHAIEEILRNGDPSDGVAFTYAQEGHHFYVLRLPTIGRTLVYDAATTLWHERQSGTDVTPGPWNITCLFDAFGKTYVGTDSGAIYELDLDTYLDGTAQIRRSVVSAPVYPDGDRGLMREIELECELGVGLNTGQGSDPQAMLRFSKDGARTWGNIKTTTLGAIGSVRNRANWHQLGMFRNGVAEISISDPVKVAIYGARYELEKLLS